MNKSGRIMMFLILMIVLVVFSIVTFFSFILLNEMTPAIKEDLTSTDAETAIDEVNDRLPTTFDGIIVMVLFLFWAFLIISSFMSDEHPVLFIFMVIIGVFILIAGVMLGNFYEELFQDSTLSSIQSSFPMSHWILTNMLIVCLIFLFSIIFGLYGKNVIK